jgi:hypothetical protein
MKWRFSQSEPPPISLNTDLTDRVQEMCPNDRFEPITSADVVASEEIRPLLSLLDSAQRLGRYGLSIGDERDVHGQQRFRLARASQETREPADVAGDAARQQCQVTGSLAH